MMRTLWKLLAVAGIGLAVWSSGASAQDNHYLCRRVKDLKLYGHRFIGFPVTFRDEINTDTCPLNRIFLVCNPISKGGGPIIDPNLHYCCYKAKCPQKPAVNFAITDQFGALGIETKKPFVLCNPCRQVPL